MFPHQFLYFSVIGQSEKTSHARGKCRFFLSVPVKCSKPGYRAVCSLRFLAESSPHLQCGKRIYRRRTNHLMGDKNRKRNVKSANQISWVVIIGFLFRLVMVSSIFRVLVRLITCTRLRSSQMSSTFIMGREA